MSNLSRWSLRGILAALPALVVLGAPSSAEAQYGFPGGGYGGNGGRYGGFPGGGGYGFPGGGGYGGGGYGFPGGGLGGAGYGGNAGQTQKATMKQDRMYQYSSVTGSGVLRGPLTIVTQFGGAGGEAARTSRAAAAPTAAAVMAVSAAAMAAVALALAVSRVLVACIRPASLSTKPTTSWSDYLPSKASSAAALDSKVLAVVTAVDLVVATAVATAEAAMAASAVGSLASATAVTATDAARLSSFADQALGRAP